MLATGRLKIIERSLNSVVNLGSLDISDLEMLRSIARDKKQVRIVGAGNSGLEHHMKSSNSSLVLGSSLSFSKNTIPSLKNRFLKSISLDIPQLAKEDSALDVQAYPKSTKPFYNHSWDASSIVDSLHCVNDCLQTSFYNMFCLGDQAILPDTPSALRNSALLSYQQRNILVDNVLSVLSNSRPRTRFKPFNWGSTYTHGIGESEVSVLGIFVLTGRLGHFFRYLVYWLRLPHRTVRFKALNDFNDFLFDFRFSKGFL